MKKLITVCAVVMLIAGMAQATNVGPITFAPGDYDNTANTVTAGPVMHNNQTTGLFRDIFWWRISSGATVGSPDYINQGNSLTLQSNHAAPGPGPYTALNFTGPIPSGGQSYLSIYDTTPADGVATKNLFDATQGLQVSADVLFVKHSTSGGVVALYNEGQDALALLAHNGGGNNADHARVDLVWQTAGSGTVLGSLTLDDSAFQTAATVNNNKTGPDFWYRVVMDLTVTGDSFDVTGTFYNHSNPDNPNSSLGSLITTILYSGSLSDPPGALVLTNPGEIGIMAMGNESISLPDNVGVSITNFQVIPEPATIALLGLGALSLLRRKRSV